MANTNDPKKSSTTAQPKNTKSIAIGLLAVALLGTWGYFLWDKNQSDEKIQLSQNQSNTAMTAKDSVQLLYNESLTRLDSLTGTNNNLQGELSERQSEITKLKNEINRIVNNKNASAAELNRAKRLIAQLNEKIGNLEAEVARLSGENQELATANTVLTTEKQTLETNLQATAAEKDQLAQTVDEGSTFTASNITIKPVQEKKDGKEKETSTARKVNKLVISFDVENRIAKSGPADLYVIVTGPDGKVVSHENMGSGTLTTRADGDLPYTFKANIEYERGTRKNVQVPLRQDNFLTGDYKIQIYQNGFKIAEGVRGLKKGGLFG